MKKVDVRALVRLVLDVQFTLVTADKLIIDRENWIADETLEEFVYTLGTAQEQLKNIVLHVGLLKDV